MVWWWIFGCFTIPRPGVHIFGVSTDLVSDLPPDIFEIIFLYGPCSVLYFFLRYFIYFCQPIVGCVRWSTMTFVPSVEKESTSIMDSPPFLLNVPLFASIISSLAKASIISNYLLLQLFKDISSIIFFTRSIGHRVGAYQRHIQIWFILAIARPSSPTRHNLLKRKTVASHYCWLTSLVPSPVAFFFNTDAVGRYVYSVLWVLTNTSN